VIDEARDWILDSFMDAEDLEDDEVIAWINKYYAGGWRAFEASGR
jgi:hypothetical protein